MNSMTQGICIVCGTVTEYNLHKKPGDVVGCQDHKAITDAYNVLREKIFFKRKAGFQVKEGHPLFDQARELSKQFTFFQNEAKRLKGE